MRAGRAALATAALTLAACGPSLPKGVDAARLQQEVSDAIGDPNTCVLIGRQGTGEVVWRYNTHTTCARALPACDAPGRLRKVGDLLGQTARDAQPRRLSCDSSADGSRGVAWASGVIPGHALVYAAVMEGNRALPGRFMAEKLQGAFEDAGL